VSLHGIYSAVARLRFPSPAWSCVWPEPRLVRKLEHRTPRYIYDWLQQMRYERWHADDPWLTPEAIRMLTKLLRPTDRGVEFGSGRSTAWFAQRVAALTSVEHNEQWYDTVSAGLQARGLANVDYVLAPRDQPDHHGDESRYARVALGFADASMDFALMDGAYRDFSAKFILPEIKPGGMLIIDNVNWFLPSPSRSPNSRTHQLGPDGDIWQEVASELRRWRTIWTTSGIWDTAIFFKP
jgi:predicted O-methyltransferase YrrM